MQFCSFSIGGIYLAGFILHQALCNNHNNTWHGVHDFFGSIVLKLLKFFFSFLLLHVHCLPPSLHLNTFANSLYAFFILRRSTSFKFQSLSNWHTIRLCKQETETKKRSAKGRTGQRHRHRTGEEYKGSIYGVYATPLLLHRHLTNLIKNMAPVIYSEVYINHK